jgi:8-oxo-dGTP diphosphatase
VPSFTYPYPRPAVTCDVVVFTMDADDLAVMLIQRKDEPFKGRWAIPGGFVNENEPLARAAARELNEETSISGLRLEQLGAFGDPGRDPRGHTITIAYVTFLVAQATVHAGDDAAAARWHPFRTLALDEVPSPSAAKKQKRLRPSAPIRLAFDHAKILTKAYQRLCRHLEDPLRDTTFDIVPPRFTLEELRRIYEVVLVREFTPRVFKKHFVDEGLVVPAAPTKKNTPARKAATQLYRWNRDKR